MATTPKLHHFRPGQSLFKEGDPSRAMYLIKRGTVSVRKRKGGSSIELARIYSNEVIGELSFFDRRPRSAAAVAITEVEALEITFDSLEQIYKSVPDYMKTIMASVAERLRKADETIRKLQKELVVDGAQKSGDNETGEAQSTAAILAATADVGFGGDKAPESETPSETEAKAPDDDELAELDKAMQEAGVSSDPDQTKTKPKK